ncbi:hypothetical protein [Azospirillum largimobile]
MITEKVPYELLVRWDETGLLAGAHAQFCYVTRDGGADGGGTVLGEFLGPAEPVTLTEEEAALIAALPSRLDAAPPHG